jgi:hypothetical protein
LPVFATPCSPAHWLELSPVFETLNDWETSPLSASIQEKKASISAFRNFANEH